jgi:mono/diheme cytochrome c family protein
MMNPRSNLLVAVLLVPCAFAVVGCSSSESDSGSGSSSKKAAPAAISPAAQAEATKIFQARCSPCHGNEGKGDGPTSKGLNPQPRDLQDHAWQTKVADGDIERIIQLGGAAVGKSPLMPPNPDLAGKPEVIKALRAHIRRLGH